MNDYTVYCHGEHRPWSTSAHKRSESWLIGSTLYGALWHCPQHRDCKRCPRGSLTDPAALREVAIP